MWVGLPVSTVLLLLVTPMLGTKRWESLMIGEGGVIEVATVVALLPACALAGWCLLQRRHLPHTTGIILAIGGLAALYFAGEEANWGQFLFAFDAPQALAAMNREKNELNLHKITDPAGRFIFNTGPRTLATLVCVVFGVVLPLIGLVSARSPCDRRSAAYWLLANYRITPVCLLAVFATLPQKFLRPASPDGAVGYVYMVLVKPAGEVKEFAIAAAILMYYLSIHLRLKALREAETGHGRTE